MAEIGVPPGDTIRRIVRAYDHPLARAYSRGRFWILRPPFLDEIGQYLPERGTVLDVGCGVGLFALYFAATAPGRFVHAIDVDPRRIRAARGAAARLGLDNVAFECADVCAFAGQEPLDAAYLIDVVHHLPPAGVPSLLAAIRRCLPDGAPLLLKDVATRPVLKRWFTWALDKAMAPLSPVRYWPPEELTGELERAGFQVRRHRMADVLPYPHILYVGAPSDRLAPLAAATPPAAA